MAGMAKCASAPSLRVAGVEMSHIPKRATQHGVFLPSWEVIPCALKPGQASLQRQLYAEEAPPLQETYLAPDLPQQSVYGKYTGSILKPTDFLTPVQPLRPKNPLHIDSTQSARHWETEYRSKLSQDAIAGSRYHRQIGPFLHPDPQDKGLDDVPAAPCRMQECTSYRDDFCRSGASLLKPGGGSTPALRSVLAAGTPKGTNHIPGYQGFLPTSLKNPYVIKTAMGENIRSVDKTNLSEQYHTRPLGYAGHLPMHVRNCYRDTPNTQTVMGRDFQTPVLNAFPV